MPTNIYQTSHKDVPLIFVPLGYGLSDSLLYLFLRVFMNEPSLLFSPIVISRLIEYTHMCHMMEFSGTDCISDKVHIVRHHCSRIRISNNGLNLTNWTKKHTHKRCQIAVAHSSENWQKQLSIRFLITWGGFEVLHMGKTWCFMTAQESKSSFRSASFSYEMRWEIPLKWCGGALAGKRYYSCSVCVSKSKLTARLWCGPGVHAKCPTVRTEDMEKWL